MCQTCLWSNGPLRRQARAAVLGMTFEPADPAHGTSSQELGNWHILSLMVVYKARPERSQLCQARPVASKIQQYVRPQYQLSAPRCDDRATSACQCPGKRSGNASSPVRPAALQVSFQARHTALCELGALHFACLFSHATLHAEESVDARATF
jgi:hypothetical protein